MKGRKSMSPQLNLNLNEILMIQNPFFLYYMYRKAKRMRPRAKLQPIRQAPRNFKRIRSKAHVFRMPPILEESEFPKLL